MPDVWYTFLSTVCARAYFARIRVFGAERLPEGGPILYVGLHRNGAVDGFVYKTVFRRGIFLIAAQLQKNLFSRIFFTGIPVVRDKDSGDRGMNAAAMERCSELLAGGGELVIFPEGTSSLGPGHLPFKSGAARIAMEAWRRGTPLKIVPLGITYDAPATFRSSVEVIAGPVIGMEQFAHLQGEKHLAEVKESLTRALENVCINVESTDYFEELRRIGAMASFGGSYFRAMKFCEKGIPTPLRDSWVGLRKAMQARNFQWSEATSPFTGAPAWVSFLAGLILAPLVAVAGGINVVPLAGAYWSGKKFPDAPNVITLWRILVGVPVFLLWFLAVYAALAFAGKGERFFVFLLTTLTGWLAYRPARQCLIAGWNGMRFAALRRQYLECQKFFQQELGKHGW